MPTSTVSQNQIPKIVNDMAAKNAIEAGGKLCLALLLF